MAVQSPKVFGLEVGYYTVKYTMRVLLNLGTEYDFRIILRCTHQQVTTTLPTSCTGCTRLKVTLNV